MEELLALQEADILEMTEKMKLTVGKRALLRRVIVQAQKHANPVSVCVSGEWVCN